MSYLIVILFKGPFTPSVSVNSATTLRQRCDDACDSVLIENNGIAPDWVCNPFSSDSIVFNENRIASVIVELTLTLGVNGP